jgi:hypothetical protein
VITPSTPIAVEQLDPLGVVDRPHVHLAAGRVHALTSCGLTSSQCDITASSGPRASARDLRGSSARAGRSEPVGGRRERRARVVAPRAGPTSRAGRPGQLADLVEALM